MNATYSQMYRIYVFNRVTSVWEPYTFQGLTEREAERTLKDLEETHPYNKFRIGKL